MFSALLALSLAAVPVPPPAAAVPDGIRADTAHVVLVATTDVHGRVTGWNYLSDSSFAGGLARAATIVDSLRARHPNQVVLLDAGDLIQGDPFAAYFAQVAPRDPHPIVEAMNLMGYDVATPGNHEFNWGLDVWRRAVAGMAFRYVSGNVFVLPGDTLAFSPYAVVKRGPVRVGVAGFTTPGVMVWDRENVRGRARVGRVEASAPRVLAALSREADLAVVVIHSGMDGSASYDTTGVGDENVAASFARLPEPARPHVVVVGHSHREMADSVIGGVHFVQPKNYVQSLSVMHVDLIPGADGRWKPVRFRGELVPLGTVAPSPRIARAMASAHEAVRGWVTQPVAEALGPMPATYGRAGSTPLGNWIHAVQLARTGADLSAASIFNTDAGFRPGPIRLADVAAIYPYENTLRAVRITGAQLAAYLEQSARYFVVDAAGRVSINDSIPGYNFDQVGGAAYTLDLSRPAGDRVRDLRVRGRPVRPTDTFTLAVNNYRQGGGGGFDMLRGSPLVYDRTENVRELLVDDLRARKTIDPARFADSSWRIVPASMAAQVRALFAPKPPAARRPAPRAAADSGVVLRVLTMNDFHGQILPRSYGWAKDRPVGGVVALDATMDSLAAACACPTVRIDAGDQMQGSLVSSSGRGRSTVDVLNRLGLDAAAIGNHDLDWSVDTLKARMAEARYPWLAANVFDSTTGRRVPWAKGWTLLRADTLRIAVIGYLTPETKGIVKPQFVKGLEIRGGAAPIRAVLDSVEAAKPHLTVLAAHIGVRCDSTGQSCGGDLLSLAKEIVTELPFGAIDLIVAGHTHWPVNIRVGGIPIIEARNNAQAVGVVDFVRGAGGDLEARARLVTPFVDAARPDSALAAVVARYQARVDSITARAVARVKVPLERDEPQYPLGFLLAEARRNELRADVGLVGNGGIRADLPAGAVNYGQVYAVQPFQNEIVRVRLTGAELRAVLERVVEEDRPDAHVSGLTVRYDPSAPAGKRVRRVTFRDGRRLRDRGRYTLATDDYLASGGSRFSALVGKPVDGKGKLDADVFAAYLRKLPQPVVAPEDPRLIPVSR
jgi:2',3'-cyclic-nucleotide 2'-phosphodiesterase (5'-nucleotidase family)